MSWLMHFREGSILVLTNEFVLKGGSVTSINVIVGVFVFVSLPPACLLSFACRFLRLLPLDC